MNKTRRFFEQEAAEVAEPNRNHRLLMAEVSSAFSALSVISCSILLFLLFASSAFAHEVRPAYLELRQTGPETYAALWKVPGQGENLRLGLYVELPAGSTNVEAPRASMANNAKSSPSPSRQNWRSSIKLSPRPRTTPKPCSTSWPRASGAASTIVT